MRPAPRRRPTRSSAARWPATGCTTCGSSSRPTASPSRTPGLHVVRRGSGATVVALGPVLDEVLEATAGRDVTVLYAHSVRPFDAGTFRSVLTSPDVVLVEPWLAGTSARCVADALVDVPHRLLALGTRRTELRHYGTPAEHQRAHGLDAAGIRRSSTRSWLRDRARPPLRWPGRVVRRAGVAQTVERFSCKEDVAGSIPVTGSEVVSSGSPVHRRSPRFPAVATPWKRQE